jgi:glucose-1-phosphate cytidylyltransferase
MREVLTVHNDHGLAATVTAVQPPGRYGSLSFATDPSRVQGFIEKPHGDGAWINGGFFVLEPCVLERISNDATSWEADVLPALANDQQLAAYRHHGFWQAMDTVRDRQVLEAAYAKGAPWLKHVK